MKKFLISEEEKNRILNLHENMKTVDKERQLESSGKKLNENVSPIIRTLIDNASSAGRISSRVMDALDNIAVRRQLLGNYRNTIQNGDDLLDAFIAGRLSNTHADDDMVRVFKKIFTSTDDDQLIEQLAKEMVEGDAQFKRGLMDGRYDPNQIYPGKQGAAIEAYVNSLKSSQGVVNPFDNDYARPGFIVGKIRALFAADPKAKKVIDAMESRLNNYIPKSKDDAAEIITENKETIKKILERKGIIRGRMMDISLKALFENPFSKISLGIFGALIITEILAAVLKATGKSGWSPLENMVGIFGLDDELEVARQNLCDTGATVFCDKKQLGGGGGGRTFDPDGSN
jgi:hypothetical protein